MGCDSGSFFLHVHLSHCFIHGVARSRQARKRVSHYKFGHSVNDRLYLHPGLLYVSEFPPTWVHLRV